MTHYPLTTALIACMGFGIATLATVMLAVAAIKIGGGWDALLIPAMLTFWLLAVACWKAMLPADLRR